MKSTGTRLKSRLVSQPTTMVLRPADPADPTSPPSPFSVPASLKKALPRNVMYLDFANTTASVQASMLLHPSGPSLDEALNPLGELALDLRTVGTFDDPCSPTNPVLTRSQATLLLNPTTHELLLEFADRAPHDVRAVMTTPSLAGFLGCLGISTTSFDLVAITTVSTMPAKAVERTPQLVG